MRARAHERSRAARRVHRVEITMVKAHRVEIPAGPVEINVRDVAERIRNRHRTDGERRGGCERNFQQQIRVQSGVRAEIDVAGRRVVRDARDSRTAQTGDGGGISHRVQAKIEEEQGTAGIAEAPQSIVGPVEVRNLGESGRTDGHGRPRNVPNDSVRVSAVQRKRRTQRQAFRDEWRGPEGNFIIVRHVHPVQRGIEIDLVGERRGKAGRR